MARLQVIPMSVGPQRGASFEVHCAPYSLGCVVAYAKAHADGALLDSVDFQPVTPRYYEDAFEVVEALSEPGVFLFSSYVWNHPSNLAVAERVKAKNPASLVVFGGPQVPRRADDAPAFFRDHPAIDILVRGEGELTLAEIIEAILQSGLPSDRMLDADLSSVTGITFRTPSGPHITPDRPRVRDLSVLPSPYTTGLFDHWISGTPHMSLETNRGCPYGCTFCDWGAATLSKIAPMSFERVFGDIEYAGKHHIFSVGICDANFGILKRDLEIARHIVKVHEESGWPRFITYSVAKVMKPELKEIVKLFHDAGLMSFGQASMQTTNEQVLKIIRRSNIKTTEYDNLLDFYRREDIPSFTEFMLGLPGQTMDTCAQDLQFVFDRKVHARIAATSVLPNAPMADPSYRAEYKIELDADGYVASSFSFTQEEYREILRLGFAYKLLANAGTGILKYLLYFMQVERGILAVDFLRAWLEVVPAKPASYPRSHALWSNVVATTKSGSDKGYMMLAWSDESGEKLLGDAAELCAEVLSFMANELGADVSGSDVEVIAAAQVSLIPSKNAAAPPKLALAHDVVSYFAALRPLANVRSLPHDFRPLREYGPGTLSLEEPFRPSLAYSDFAAPAYKFELRSTLAL